MLVELLLPWKIRAESHCEVGGSTDMLVGWGSLCAVMKDEAGTRYGDWQAGTHTSLLLKSDEAFLRLFW